MASKLPEPSAAPRARAPRHAGPADTETGRDHAQRRAPAQAAAAAARQQAARGGSKCLGSAGAAALVGLGLLVLVVKTFVEGHMTHHLAASHASGTLVLPAGYQEPQARALETAAANAEEEARAALTAAAQGAEDPESATQRELDERAEKAVARAQQLVSAARGARVALGQAPMADFQPGASVQVAGQESRLWRAARSAESAGEAALTNVEQAMEGAVSGGQPASPASAASPAGAKAPSRGRQAPPRRPQHWPSGRNKGAGANGHVTVRYNPPAGYTVPPASVVSQAQEGMVTGRADQLALELRNMGPDSGEKASSEEPSWQSREGFARLSPAPAVLGEQEERDKDLRQRCLFPDRGDGGKPCSDCCNDGYQRGPCFDVDACASEAGRGSNRRYGLVYAQVGKPGWPWMTNIGSLRRAGDKIFSDAEVVVDIILIIPRADVEKLGAKHHEYIKQWNVKVVPVDWTLPPPLKWHPPSWWPGKPDGWCGPQDLVRLHVIGLEGYDAVAFYDQDVEIQGDIGPSMRCASTGKFLSTTGGVGEPMNVGFFALRPHKLLLKAAELWARDLNFSNSNGWGGLGFSPSDDKFVGAECGQGYFHTLFYKQNATSIRSAMVAAGIMESEDGGQPLEGAVTAAQVDKCIWNYQHAADCPPRFNCSRIVAHHKPNAPPEGDDCGKSWFVKVQQTPPPTPMPALDPAPHQPCEMKTVEIGQNCNCDVPNAHIKSVLVNGYVRSCDPSARNPSGDSFCVSSYGSTVRVTREDNPSCWCDPGLRVRCCVVPPGARDPPLAELSPAPPPRNSGVNHFAGDRVLRQRCQPAKRGIARPCQDCCNDGFKKGPCLNVEACAEKAQPGGRYGLVYAQVGKPGMQWMSNIGSLRRAGDKLAAAANATVDIVLIIPSWDLASLDPEHRDHIKTWSVQVIPVNWTVPPALKWHPSDWWPGKPEGWCGPQDLVRLHTLGLAGYEGVAFYDQDVEIQGDLSPILRCASTGKFLSATGGTGEPMNVGFFAVRPDARLLRAAELWAENLTFSWDAGWDKLGFLPAENKFVGAECGQGYFHTLFYKQAAPSVRRAFEAAGIQVAGAGVDKCIWNYQHGADCGSDFDCSRVVGHHKPNERPEGGDCGKSWFRSDQGLVVPTPMMDPDSRRACQWKSVDVGKSCDCESRAAWRKTVVVPGFVRECDALARNPSGDAFCVSFEGDTVTAARSDSQGCWCDPARVKCCIVAP